MNLNNLMSVLKHSLVVYLTGMKKNLCVLYMFNIKKLKIALTQKEKEDGNTTVSNNSGN